MILTKFSDNLPNETIEFNGNEGASLLCWIAANDHINTGGWVTIDLNNTCYFFDKRIEL